MPLEKTSEFPFTDPRTLSKAAVVCHRNADADAYLSAFAVSSLLRRLSPTCKVVIGTPGGMTALTMKLSKRFPHDVEEESSGEYDLYVAVDVGDTELLDGWKERMENGKGVRVLVDHHPLRAGRTYDHMVVDEGATSAAEVVFRLFGDLGVDIDRTTAQALLEAILFDSSHLTIAGADCLRAVVALMDRGADIAEARRELRTDPDYGEVLAKLKGAQRLRIYRVGDWVASTSMIGSFQAHVARSLVYLGADFAISGGESEGETRVSLRATQRFAEKSGVKLGRDVAEAVSRELGGHGGGHATAASYSTPAEAEAAVKETLKRIASILGSEVREIT